MIRLTPIPVALMWGLALLGGIVVGWRKGKTLERNRCAAIASMFTMKSDRSIHPDIPWEEMSETAKRVAHTTAQQIAAKIMEGDGW